ncbi:DUF1376 domain-containing protein [Propionivibrio sp.]|uniref:DUF1376 domain-containing protein n=1 Tax=Propionivibrio sp. TaxID=2212460 RepID=UPI003BEF7B80
MSATKPASRSCTSNPPRPFRFSVQLPELMADTAHLEPEELGCYLRILFSYWRVGPPKNDDRTLSRIVGLPLKEWAVIRPELEPFFDIGREWIHWRQDEELSAAYEAITANRKRTAAATAARKQRNDQRDVVRNDQRNDQRDDGLDVARSEDPTGSKQEAKSKTKSPAMKQDFDRYADFDSDVAMAEESFAAGVDHA